ncbi:hypothetical protein CTEN210_18262 [Chaetoceros tenuissimus]|uniref:ETS domain-containing protein n=1 Tax=Chaetoceros tenuissimus TaxID=426638 RepID=A0AAD3HFV9_9STRA|nr:hypothetical protein CTEN210_18262 [Chaetoceros tenuissimus]
MNHQTPQNYIHIAPSGRPLPTSSNTNVVIDEVSAPNSAVEKMPTPSYVSTALNGPSIPVTKASAVLQAPTIKTPLISSVSRHGPREPSPPDTEEEITATTHQASKTFPQQLMQILSDASISDVITWLPHGKSFKILKPNKLAERVNKHISSFISKLNRWGFRRVKRGPDSGTFYHDLFIRDQPHLCLQMFDKQRNQKESARRRLEYAMTPVHCSSFAAVQHSQTKYTHPRIVSPTFIDHVNHQTAMASNSSSPTPTNGSVAEISGVGGYMYTPVYYWPSSCNTTSNASFVHPHTVPAAMGTPFSMNGSYTSRRMTPHVFMPYGLPYGQSAFRIDKRASYPNIDQNNTTHDKAADQSMSGSNLGDSKNVA